jgi:hypothetical protein
MALFYIHKLQEESYKFSSNNGDPSKITPQVTNPRSHNNHVSRVANHTRMCKRIQPFPTNPVCVCCVRYVCINIDVQLFTDPDSNLCVRRRDARRRVRRAVLLRHRSAPRGNSARSRRRSTPSAAPSLSAALQQ